MHLNNCLCFSRSMGGEKRSKKDGGLSEEEEERIINPAFIEVEASVLAAC